MNIRTVLAFPDLIPKKKGQFEDEVEKGLPVAVKRAAVSGFALGINQFIQWGVLFGVGMYIGFRFVDAGTVEFSEVYGALSGVLMGGMGLGMVCVSVYG